MPISLRARAAALVSLIGFAAAGALASPLTLVDDLRFVRSGPFPDLCPDVSPSPPFSPFSGGVGCIGGNSTQTSTAGPTHLAGTGRVSTTGGGAGLDVISHYEITFTVDDPTPFAFDATFSFDMANGRPTPNPGTEVRASLTGSSLGLPLPPLSLFSLDPGFQSVEVDEGFFVVSIDGPTMFNEQGVLQPGFLYRLIVRNRSDFEADVASSWDFTFLVPETGTGTLLFLTLLFGASKRRSGSQRPLH